MVNVCSFFFTNNSCLNVEMISLKLEFLICIREFRGLQINFYQFLTKCIFK